MHKLKRLLNLSSPRRGLKEEVWRKIQTDAGYMPLSFARPLILQPAFLVLILLLLGGFGTGVYAYESPSVQEGHILEPVKRTLEAVELRLARAPEAQVKTRLRLATKRLREVEYNKKRRKVLNPRIINQADMEIDRAAKLVPTIKNEKKRQAVSNHLDRVRVLRVRGGEDLIKLKSQISPSRKAPQIKFKNGQRLNYLDYQPKQDKKSAPDIRYEKSKPSIRSKPRSFNNALSGSKSSRQTPESEKRTKKN